MQIPSFKDAAGSTAFPFACKEGRQGNGTSRLKPVLKSQDTAGPGLVQSCVMLMQHAGALHLRRRRDSFDQRLTLAYFSTCLIWMAACANSGLCERLHQTGSRGFCTLLDHLDCEWCLNLASYSRSPPQGDAPVSW
ncbi:hypothetical protein LIA77_09104 [Sarocladium implicatum]|nr:hypothetical protein LIA77_09104 [Sarocladium implicatum]